MVFAVPYLSATMIARNETLVGRGQTIFRCLANVYTLATFDLAEETRGVLAGELELSLSRSKLAVVGH